MTNFEKLHFMELDELAGWMDENCVFDNSKWMTWFNDKYCKNCHPIMCHYKETPFHEFPCAYCELYDGCKMLPDYREVPNNLEIIKMWLNKEVEI